MSSTPHPTAVHPLEKALTGIRGLDEVLYGGLPERRTTLVKGAAGTGKTLLALEFLYRSAVRGEPTIFVTFEETAAAIRQNAAAIGWDLAALEDDGKLIIWQAQIDRAAVTSGDFTIDAVLAAIQGQAAQLGARRLAIDAVDILMGLFEDPRKERHELYRLHDWLITQQFTTVITSKLAPHAAAGRYDFLDYLADCVVQLDVRVLQQMATRRLRILKYRGSNFCSNEYPYLITEDGNVVMPITAARLARRPLGAMVTTGNVDFDRALGGGLHRGACAVLCGPSGGGKTTFAATFARQACAEGAKVLYISFEESAEAITAAMHSPGINLRPAVARQALIFHTLMPEYQPAEHHLHQISQLLDRIAPDHVIIDAISACTRLGPAETTFDFLVRLINACKQRGVTCLMTNQTPGNQHPLEVAVMDISSIVDTVVCLCLVEVERRIRRELVVIKSRGAHHTDRYHGFAITDNGIRIEPASDDSGER